jgi:hypothetical protein
MTEDGSGIHGLAGVQFGSSVDPEMAVPIIITAIQKDGERLTATFENGIRIFRDKNGAKVDPLSETRAASSSAAAAVAPTSNAPASSNAPTPSATTSSDGD